MLFIFRLGPGVIFIFCALILNFLVSVSLPFFPTLYITHNDFTGYGYNSAAWNISQGSNELRLGAWASCWYNSSAQYDCLQATHAYSLVANNDGRNFVLVEPSWTRGLAVHPIAAVVTLIAFLFSLSTHVLIASWVSLLAASLTFIAMILDFTLNDLLITRMGELFQVESTTPGPAPWMTLASLILLLFPSCIVFRKPRDSLVRLWYPVRWHIFWDTADTRFDARRKPVFPMVTKSKSAVRAEPDSLQSHSSLQPGFTPQSVLPPQPGSSLHPRSSLEPV